MGSRILYAESFTGITRKKFPSHDHRVLFLETNEYVVKMHSCLERLNYYQDIFSGDSYGRILITSKKTGSYLEYSGEGVNFDANEYIDKLLKTKDRNRVVFRLELGLHSEYSDIFDDALPTLDDDNGPNCFYFNSDAQAVF